MNTPLSKCTLQSNNSCEHATLIQHGFQKYGNKYILKFPLHKYKKTTVIELNILISTENEKVELEVMDCTTNSLYTPFYNSEYPSKKNNLVLQKVERKANKKVKELIECGVLHKKGVLTNGE